jgi:hypothetical protein
MAEKPIALAYGASAETAELLPRLITPQCNKIRGGAIKKFPEFFNKDGLVHREFVPPAQSVTVQVL